MKTKNNLKGEVERLKNKLSICLAVIMVLVAVIVRGWTA